MQAGAQHGPQWLHPSPDPNPNLNPDPNPSPTPDPNQVRMDRGAFTRLLGPLDSLLDLRKYTATGEEVAASEGGAEGGVAGGARGGEGSGPPAVPVPPPGGRAFAKAEAGSLRLADFSVTKGTLGEGAFGKARRCLHPTRTRTRSRTRTRTRTSRTRTPNLTRTRCAAAGSRRAARSTHSSRCARRTSSPWGRWRTQRRST